MRHKALAAFLIAAVVAGAAAACHHHGLDGVLADWLAGRLEWLSGLRRMPALQHTAYAMAALLAAWFCLALTGWARRVGFLLGLVFMLWMLLPVLSWQGVFFEPFISVAAALLAGGIAMLWDAGSQHRAGAAAAFAGRLSRAEFERWWSRQRGASLAARCQATVITCHLLNAEELRRGLEPEAWGRMTSWWRQRLGDFLIGRGGYLAAADPVRLQVWFGFPNPDETHALNAARAALDVVRLLEDWETNMLQAHGIRPRLGLALASGEFLAAPFACGTQTNWQLSGLAAELGERLVLENARFGSRVMISTATHQQAAEGLEVRPLDLLPQGGSAALGEVYELLALKHGLSEDQAVARDAFWQGVILLRQGDTAAALRQFERAAIPGVEDAPLAYYKAKAGVQKC